VPSVDITEEATNANGATVTYTKPTATDVVDGYRTVSCSPDSGSTFALGTTEVTCTASDTRSNTSTAKFNVTVADKTAPVIAANDDVTADAENASGATVSYTKPTATDNVDADVTVNCSPASGTKFSLGDTTVTCNATDKAGNKATPTTFKVTVADKTAPVIAAHDDVTADAENADGAKVSYTKPSATDNVDASVTVDCSPASGAKFPLGSTEVTCTAKDAAGNEATPTTFKVTVSDTTAPALTVPGSVVVAEATDANGATVNFASDVSANDAVDPSPQVTCTPDSGSTFPLGTTTVSCKAKDASGNESAAKTFDVTVKDTTAPTLGSHADVSEVATSSSGAVVNYTKPAATDAVDPNPTVTCTPAPGATFPIGSTTVSCSATDKAGNKAEESFEVSVTYAWSGALQPINGGSTPEYSDDISIFKLGSTVPVKFTLTDASAGTSGAEAKLYAAKVTNEVVGTEVETTSTATASSGNLFRYDASSGQYVFNWSTKGLTAGTYQLRIDLADGATRTVRVSLR
jgi:hypothetical protein